MRTLLLSTSAVLSLTAGAAWAEEETAVATEPTDVAPVTVIATRNEARTDEIPVTVSVITAHEIEENLYTDIKDLVRFEPGVSVPTSPQRFTAALSGAGRDGNSGFTIRGMGGDRVLIVTDGIRVPGGFSFGAQNVGRGGYSDLDLMQRVEILRGPASALYGSDGIAGAVSFTTRDPEDMLRGESFTARGRVGYSSADESWTEGVSIAGSNGALSGLLAYTRRDAQETENQGDNFSEDSTRTAPNPIDLSSNAVLGKLVWQAAPNHRLRLTYDHYDSEMSGDSLSSRSAASLQVLGEDEQDRDRISVDHRFTDFLGLERGSWAVYWQDATTRQFTFEDREPLPDRTRDVTFDNRIYGLNAQGQRTFGRGGAIEHRVTFGGDWSQATQEAIRDGTVPGVGETFPNRPVPITDYSLAGLFLQDEIMMLDGRLIITPALRYDRYELTPVDDALYSGATVEGQSDSHVSPKLGVVYWPTGTFGLFANAAEGFKAPSPMQVNNYFANPVFGYTSIPNPDLGPETSTSIEGGIRFRNVQVAGGDARLQLAAFRSDYDDFISQIGVSGTGVPGVDPLIYQYVNLGSVSVHGFEARGDIAWDNGFSFTAAFSYADGEQVENGERAALPSVDPIKLVAGVGYAEPAGRWGGQAIVTWSAQKDEHETNGLGCYDSCFTGDDFTLLDLTAYWNVNDNVTLRAGVFNVLDETYSWWSDIGGLSSTSAVLDAYTQPGRNFSVSLTLRY
ncbi:MAG: TonB-dependent hemoglobin/transferrin/lactoferrin family receptor [Brevundimonas sp.]|uniref:TonB-dependent hemoglobin/transferrin/lactoferrin family receptor n=1 Tax=Brevundimonas sp. TaxID=1871086 RepID=UPI00391AC71F